MQKRMRFKDQLYFVGRWNLSRRRVQCIYYTCPTHRRVAAAVYLSNFVEAQHHYNYDLAIWQVYSPDGEIEAMGSERRDYQARKQALMALKGYISGFRTYGKQGRIQDPGWFFGRDSPLG